METEDIRGKLLTLLTTIAPDIDPQSVDPDRELRDQFDFDSMDTLHFAAAVSDAFHIAIAETEYPKLARIAAAADFVRGKLTQGREGVVT
ncbi:MAG TPA: acyl carrier protein [Steroidobacteraceae bacterium]|nr:acyl carrier protein [Steroidobacteraceae bacterium]